MGKDEVRWDDGLVRDWSSDPSYLGFELGERVSESFVVLGPKSMVDRGIELIELGLGGVGDLELAIAEDPDDHAPPSFFKLNRSAPDDGAASAGSTTSASVASAASTVESVAVLASGAAVIAPAASPGASCPFS